VQLSQLGDQPGRHIYIAFDQDSNQAGQQSATSALFHLGRKRREGGFLLGLPPAVRENRAVAEADACS
jgi:hypothetical protein